MPLGCRHFDVDDLGLDLGGSERGVGSALGLRLFGVGRFVAARLALHRRHLLAALAEDLLLQSFELLLLKALFFGDIVELLLQIERMLFPRALVLVDGNHPDV